MGRENIRLYFSRTLCLTSVTQVLITIIYYWEKRPRVKAEMIIEKPRPCLSKHSTIKVVMEIDVRVV